MNPTKSEFSPQDIRRIRERLGLSQVEAGELLGGGPRAFTKYEAGTTNPAASILNMLRLLDANPAALEILAGRKTVVVNADPSKPGDVSGPHVAALTPRKFAILARRLLSAEAQSGGLPQDGIHVAANITAPDGGEDARIEWQGGPDRTAFLLSRLSEFQLKAGAITPKKAGLEVLDSDGNVKPMIRAALEAGGTYTVLCAASYTKSEIKKREDQIRKHLTGAGLTVDAARIQFRDADQIALWVNQHRGVAAWLLEQTQPGLIGPFRDWAHWASRHEHESSSRVDDPRLPAIRDKLRQLVALPRGVARVIGLSGVGKSRLVLEALGSTDKEEADHRPYLSDIVLYAVESEVGPIAIKTTVQNMVDASVRAIVVIDRCESQTHDELADMVKRSASRLSLITIDDHIPSHPTLPADTLKVEPADNSVIDAMLRLMVPNLPAEDHRRLVNFAGGFPRLAVLIVPVWTSGEPIASVSSEALIEHIVLGRKCPNEQVFRQAAMLLGTFGLLGARSPADEDLDHVVRFSPALTRDALLAAINDLERRGVVQLRGRLAVLTPRPIAIALAERQWRSWSHQVWDEVLTGDLPASLRVRAARQLALLNTTPIASEIVRHVCRLNGPLASLDGISAVGSAKVVSSLAEVDSQVVVGLLEHVLGSMSPTHLRKVGGETRRNIVWALEKLAFEPKTFDRGAPLLLDLAVAENETWGNNATGQYKALFPVLLGNTAAGPEPRLRVLDDALKTDDLNRLKIVVDALLQGAKTDFFSRAVGVEVHGLRRALEPWQPKLWQDAWEYVAACLLRLGQIATRVDEIGDRARTGIGHDLRALVSRGSIELVEELVTTVTKVHGTYWPEALSSLGDVLVYDREGLEPDVEQRVHALIRLLTPNDIANRVRFLVTEMPWDYPVDERLEFEERNDRQYAAVEQLVVELLREPATLAAFLPSLSQGEQRMAVAFGKALAAKAAAPLEWRQPILKAYADVPSEQRNFGILTGYFTVLAEREPEVVTAFKQEACRSEVFAPTLPAVCLHVGIQANDIDLVCQALAAGLIQPFLLRHWAMGGVLAKLPEHTVAPLFDQVFSMDDKMFSVGIDLLGMYVHGRYDRLEMLRPQLRLGAGFAARRRDGRGSQMDLHHFQELMGWMLSKGRTDADAMAVAMTLTKQIIADADKGGEHPVKPLLPKLLAEFPDVVWPLLGNAIASDPKNGWRFEFMLGDKYAFGEQSPAALTLPEPMLFSWAHAHPEVGPAFLAKILPALESRDPNIGATWHPMMKRLLDEFGDRDDVLSALTGNMYTFSWSGSRAPYFELYQRALGELETHPIGAVRRWAAKMKSHFGHEAAGARAEDEELHAGWDL